MIGNHTCELCGRKGLTTWQLPLCCQYSAEDLVTYLRSPQAGLLADERVQAAADLLERLSITINGRT